MEKDENYSDQPMPPAPSFSGLHQGYDLPQSSHHHLLHQQDQFMKSRSSIETSSENGNGMLSYFLNNPQQQQYLPHQPQLQQIASLDKLSFAEVMQFADFGPKLSLNGQNNKLPADEDDESGGIDPVYFLKFPVLNDRSDHQDQTTLMEGADIDEVGMAEKGRLGEDGEGRVSDHSSVQIRTFLGEDEHMQNNNNNNNNNGNSMEGKNKRKRTRTVKTSQEVESQRMTHIAVERNRRKQMNEHLRVLRSLMPGSYVQRGDQASIIGGAIEFVRELEQLLQCLESQKRRRLLGEAPTLQAALGSADSSQLQPPPQPPFLPPGAVLPHPNDNQIKIMDFETPGALIHEETAESKSCLADVEVKLLGFDAMIKILSRRRPGQLIKAIAALEDLQLNILHTNITTIEQTVLYSFNVKVASESRFTAEDIASSVQQIFGFIHANSAM